MYPVIPDATLHALLVGTVVGLGVVVVLSRFRLLAIAITAAMAAVMLLIFVVDGSAGSLRWLNFAAVQLFYHTPWFAGFSLGFGIGRFFANLIATGLPGSRTSSGIVNSARVGTFSDLNGE